MATYSRPFRRSDRGRRSRYYSVIVYDRGRQTKRSTREMTLKGALGVVDRWRQGKAGTGGPRGFIAAIDAWLADKAPRISRGYQRVYWSYRNQWAAHWGTSELAEITVGEIDQYLRLRLARRKSAQTVNGERAALRSFFAWAQDRGWVGTNPARLVGRFPTVRRSPRALDEKQEAALLEAAQGEGDRVFGFILTMLHSGLRRGTVAQLEWSDVDLGRGEWQVAGEKMKSREDFRGRRLSAVLCAFLRGLNQDRHKIFGRLAKDAWGRVVARAGLDWLRPHDLRRTFFTRCRRAGAPMEVAMWLSDHRDVRTALECYREIDPSEAAQALGRAFPGPE